MAKMAIPEFWRKTNTGVPFSSKSADFVVKSFWQYVLQTKKKGQSNHEVVHGLLPATPWDRKKAVEFLDKYWKFGAVRNLVFKKKNTKKEIKKEREQLKVMMA